MAKNDPFAQLQAVDRWGSRKRRLAQFVLRNGISGLLGKASKAGVGGTVRFIGRQLRYQTCSYMGRRWDRKYGVDTSGQIDLVDISVLGPNKTGGYSSVSTSPSAFAFLSAFFPPNWEHFTFVDVGCGKGRVLMLAALYGFDTIIGIEFAPLLCDVANRNLTNFTGCRPADWSVVNADAATIDLPVDGPLLIYSFNPFNADIWKLFITNLIKAREVGKHPLCLVLSGTLPQAMRAAAAVIQESGRFRRRAHGVTPFFLDAYAPYHFWVFDAI